MKVLFELESLLNKERQLILNGRFADLEALADRKTSYFEALNRQQDPPPESIKKLVKLAIRNSELLEAASRGVKAAIRQIEEAGEIGDQNFYGADGERQRMVSGPNELQQKL